MRTAWCGGNPLAGLEVDRAVLLGATWACAGGDDSIGIEILTLGPQEERDVSYKYVSASLIISLA